MCVYELYFKKCFSLLISAINYTVKKLYSYYLNLYFDDAE